MARTDKELLVAGRLVALSREIVVRKAEDSISGEITETRTPWIPSRLAEVVAQDGLPRARGWLDGWWYASGTREVGNHPTWVSCLSILGEDPRD